MMHIERQTPMIENFYFCILDFNPVLVTGLDQSENRMRDYCNMFDFLGLWCDKWNFRNGFLSLIRKNYGHCRETEQDWVEYEFGDVLCELPNP